MPSDRPNVLVIQADQWRGQAMGCAGNEQIETPTLDQLAADGVNFDRAYTPYPLCSPARGSIQTGCYPHTHGVIANSFLDMWLPDSVDTIAEILRDEGYDTGYIGKWHLDGSGEEPWYVPPERQRGYDFWRGFERDQHQHFRGHPLFASSSKAEWVEGRQPDIQTDMALDYLNQERDLPFYLYLSWSPPHMPYEAPDEYSDRYDPEALDLRPNVPEDEAADARETMAEYYGMCTWLDDNLERLLAGLEEQGLADDTIVVFTSDHGEFMGSHGRYGKTGPHEESSRIPFIVRYPDEIDGGRRSDAFINLVDLAPTLLSICGAPIPDIAEGQDLSELWLTGEGPAPEACYMQGWLQRESSWRGLRTDRYLIVVGQDLDVLHLYDLEEDPYQQENLAAVDDPDAPVDELRERLVDRVYEYDDREFKTQANIDFSTDERVFDFDDQEIRR